MDPACAAPPDPPPGAAGSGLVKAEPGGGAASGVPPPATGPAVFTQFAKSTSALMIVSCLEDGPQFATGREKQAAAHGVVPFVGLRTNPLIQAAAEFGQESMGKRSRHRGRRIE